jgi:hypothetical protein
VFADQTHNTNLTYNSNDSCIINQFGDFSIDNAIHPCIEKQEKVNISLNKYMQISKSTINLNLHSLGFQLFC